MRRQLLIAVLATFMLFFLHAHRGFAQSSEDIQTLKKDVESLKEGQKSIQKELDDLKKLLQARQAPPAPAPFKETVIDVDHAPTTGDKNAKLVLVEFSDYQ